MIIVINKIDRENAEPKKMYEKVLELLLELNATEEQFDAPVVYGSGRDGYMMMDLGQPKTDMGPLFQTILDHVPPPFAKPEEPFHMLVSNIDWSDYVGRIAIGKVLGGAAKVGDPIFVVRHADGKRLRTKISQIFEFTGLGTAETPTAVAGNIVGFAGFEDIDIGDTLTADEAGHALPFTQIDPPTLEMQFCVNDGPLVGREGKLVTSRQLRERLYRELKTNVSIKVEDTDKAGVFNVKARGAMQVAVLVDTMRREGFELLVSRPTVIREGRRTASGPGALRDPLDRGARRVRRLDHAEPGEPEGPPHQHGEAPALDHDRGHDHDPRPDRLRDRHRERDERPRRPQPPFQGIRPEGGRGPDPAHRHHHRHGGRLHHGLRPGNGPGARQDVRRPRRGGLRGHDRRRKSPQRGHRLQRRRGQGGADQPSAPRARGVATGLTPATKLSLERAIEYIASDEFAEVTPKSLRLRKRVLREVERRKIARNEKNAAG